MNYEKYNAKVLAENPEVKEEYATLEMAYEAIRERIAGRKNEKS